MNRLISLLTRTATVCGLLASMTAQAKESADSWVNLLSDPTYAEAAKQCLAVHPKSSPPTPPMVENAWAVNRDAIGVLTVDLQGLRQSCYVDKRSGRVERTERVLESDGPLFISIQDAPTKPSGACIVADRVMSERKLVGWLLRQRPAPSKGPDACSTPIWSDLRN